MPIDKNIVADYGAPNDGSAGLNAALLSFKSDAQGQTSILRFPAGTYDIKAGLSGPDVRIFDGIPNLTVILNAAATITDDSGTASFALGGSGIDATIHVQPKIATVLAGASSVVLLDAADAPKFTVGRYVVVSSFDLQGSWQSGFGSPRNNQWEEYAKVTGISGLTISLDRVLKFTHKSTWPWYSGAVQTDGPDQGGPAMVTPLPANWDAVHEYRGGTWDLATVNAINCPGRTMLFSGTTIIGDRGINPSTIGDFTFHNSDLQFSMEVDKVLGTIAFSGNTTADQVQFQSASGELIIRDTANISNLNGTPRRVTAIGSGWTVQTFKPGPNFYGRSDGMSLGAGTISAFTTPGGQHEQGTNGEGVNVSYTMNIGIIRIPNTLGAKPWCVPGTHCYFCGQHDFAVPFTVTDVTQDATYTYVQTDLSGGFPDIPLSSGKITIRVHPCPNASFNGTIGNATVVDAAAQRNGRPLYEYSNRSYTKANTVGAISAPVNFGDLNSINFNVSTAYAGATNPLTLGFTVIFYDEDNNDFRWEGTIDLRTAGLRTITTANGGSSAKLGSDDIPALPSSVRNWMTEGVGLNPSNNVSGQATGLAFSVEINLNQGMSEEETEAEDSGEFLALHSDHAPVKHYAKLNKVEQLVRRVAPEQIPEPTILPRDFFEDVPKKKRRFTIADGFSDA